MNAQKNRPAPSKTEQLIPIIQSNDNTDPLIDARLLHKQLGISTKFTMWIERRIQEFGFMPNVDYSQFWEKGVFGRKTHYHLTMDMAKELAMVERTPTGRMIRQYFIKVEKEFIAKRLYGQVATLSEIKKKVPTINFMNATLYSYRDCQSLLGYSTKSGLSNVRRKYENQLAIINRKSYISEPYLKLMISRATSRSLAVITLKAKPVALPQGFGQLNLSV